MVTAGGPLDEFPREFTLAVPPPGEGETDALVEVMRRFAGDRSLTESMGARARRFAEEECSWERIARDYVAILEGESPRRPAPPVAGTPPPA